MGRLRIKPEKKFVRVVEPYRSPATRRREWFVATMFIAGTLSSLFAVGYGLFRMFQLIPR